MASDESAARIRLLRMVSELDPYDDLARAHLDATATWITSGAALWRTVKPDLPLMHLVSYFVVHDPLTRRLLLVDHRGAGLRLPTGGHIEPGEDPWDTVIRESAEELHHVPSGGPREPLFLTMTETRGAGRHTDVSLWFVVEARERDITWYDETEFSGVAWLTAAEINAMPVETLDPHMHRFLRSASF